MLNTDRFLHAINVVVQYCIAPATHAHAS
jgi:hypothetical protein